MLMGLPVSRCFNIAFVDPFLLFSLYSNVFIFFDIILFRIFSSYVQGYESASKRAFVISIAFGLMSQPINFRFSSLQTTAVVPEPK